MALKPIQPREQASPAEKEAYRQAQEHARLHPRQWANARQQTAAVPREAGPREPIPSGRK